MYVPKVYSVHKGTVSDICAYYFDFTIFYGLWPKIDN